MITSEWGTPNMVEGGVNPELLLAGKYGNALHVWDLHSRRHLQKLELGPEYQMVLELRPAHDPNETYGFVGVVTSLKDLSASVWMWHREGSNRNGIWRIHKAIEIPAEPAAAAQGLRRSAAADYRHQPFARRSIPVRIVLWHRRAEAIRCVGSPQPCRDRLSEARGHRSAPGAPGASESTAERRTPDGGDQP
jgi:hypothetical protein